MISRLNLETLHLLAAAWKKQAEQLKNGDTPKKPASVDDVKAFQSMLKGVQ